MTSVTFDPELIRELLAHQGRTGTWLAESTGYSRTHVSRMLNGVEPVSEDFARLAARAMDVPLRWFVQREVAVA